MAANDVLYNILEEYGLEDLYDFAEDVWTDGATATELILKLQDQPVFKDRFKGLALRQQNGLAAISVDDYIATEREYEQILASFGLPKDFYDSPDDFAEFIGNDVSADELEDRAALASRAASEVDPQLKMQLETLYGITDDPSTERNELVAYFIDPERAVPLIEQRLQMEAAGLSSAAQRSLGQGLNRQTAERLADPKMAVQQREITERLAPKSGLTQATLGDQGVTTSELAASEFGLDSETTAMVKRLRQRRQTRSMRQTGVMTGSAGITGLGSTQRQAGL